MIRGKRKQTLMTLLVVVSVLSAEAATYRLHMQKSWVDDAAKTDQYLVKLTSATDYRFPYMDVTGGTTVELEASVLKGREVVGWSYGPTDDVTVFNKGHYATYTETNERTFQVTPRTELYVGVHEAWLKYDIAFNGNGGTGTMSGVANLVYNVPQEIPSVGYTRTGYEFQGWSRDAKATTAEFADGATVSGKSFGLDYQNKSVTLFAVWKAKTVTLTLDPQGGTVSSTSQQVTYDSAIGTLPTPTKTGHTFKGWYTANTGGTQVTDATVSKYATAATVYAQWSVNNYKITVQKSGEGTGTVSPSGSASYAYGSTLTLTATAGTGSKFTQWTDGVKTAERTVTVGAANKTYTAQFELQTFTVTFDPGEGTVSPTSKIVTYGKAYGELPKPTRTGHTFIEWRNSAGNRVTAESTVQLSANQTLTAAWTVNRHTIQTLVNTAGEGSGTASGGGTYDYGTKVTIQAKPDTGSRFDAWNDGDKNPSREITVVGDKAYTATFALEEYTVEFVYYDAEDRQQTESQQVKYRQSATPPAKDVVDRRAKHHFTGWGNTSYGTVTGNLHVEAVYAINTYTIVFERGGATSGNMSEQIFEADGQKTLPANRYAKTGHTFAGWSCAELGRTFGDGEVIEGLTTVHGKTLVFTATWKPNIYALTFEPQGGTASALSGEVTYGTTYGDLPTATREGYTFDGWFTSTSVGTKIESTTPVTITADQTLYAHWTAKTYTVTFDANKGEPASKPSMTVTFGKPYGTLATTKRTGYDFAGWHNRDDKKVVSTSTVMIPEDHTLVAKWTAQKFWVYLRPGSGTVEKSQIQVTYDEPYAGLVAATRKGYDFGGWYTAAEGGDRVNNGDRVAITEGMNLYAHWTAKTYTLTFDANGGMCAEATRTIAYDAKYDTLPTATRTGYNLDGWYVGSSRIYNSDTFCQEGDQTLTAHWSPKTYRVRFNANGGSGYMSDISATWDVSFDFASNAFVKPGYTFVGWALDPEQSEPTYVEPVKDIKNLSESDLTLYAVWKVNHYTIRFDKNGGLGAMADLGNVQYDQLVTLPQATFTYGINAFKGWTGEQGEQYEDQAVVSNLTTVANAVYVLKARWSDDYQIRYYGNGATNVEDYVQNISASEKNVKLTPCQFEKQGYTFGGWATNQLFATRKRPTYRDGATAPSAKVGDKIDLYAVWSNNTYRVVCYPNGGQGEVTTADLVYDVETTLPTTIRDGFIFVGWALDPIEGDVLPAILNLTTVPDATVSVFARWQRASNTSLLAIAADCDHDGADRLSLNLTGDPGCSVVAISDKGGNGQCVKIEHSDIGSNEVAGHKVMMKTSVVGSGTMSFHYQVSFGPDHPDDDCYFYVYIKHGEKTETKVDQIHDKNLGLWAEKSFEIPEHSDGDPTEIYWAISGYVDPYYDKDDYALIDNIRWWPSTGSPASMVGLTFRLNDGEKVAPADIFTNLTCKVGTVIEFAPSLPIKNGVTALGWSTNQTATSGMDMSTWVVPAEDVQLYAVWKSGSEDHPVPTEADRPVIGAGFSFMTDARFDYVIWTTESLESPIVWTPGEPIQGTGEAVKLPGWLGVAAGGDALRYGDVPQRFYKVEVRQRK